MATKPYVAEPPRTVPLTTTVSVLFGGFLPQFGFAWLLFTVPFIFAFLPLKQLSGLLASSEKTTATGQVTAREFTNSSINDQRVVRYRFRFRAQDGRGYEGTSYTTDYSLEKGTSVPVTYPAHDPTKAVIVGQRLDAFPAWTGLFVGIFPLIGIGLLAVHFAKAPKRLKVLRWGRYATGRLRHKTATNVRINNQPVMKLTYEVSLPSGKTFEAEARSHLTQKLEDDAEEPLLYLEKPTGGIQAQLLDNLPGRPRFDQNGNIEPAPAATALAVSILPSLILLGLLIGGYFLAA